MWRFNLVVFVALGATFYVMSGGADYKPVTQSIQARAKLDNERPNARPEPVKVVLLDEDGNTKEEIVARSDTTLQNLGLTKDGEFKVVLTSANKSTDTQTSAKFETVREDKETLAVIEEVVEASEAIEEVAEVENSADIRTVNKSSVNMRGGPGTNFDRIERLTLGQEVEVLQEPGNGWIKLRAVESGRVGWMADWLITAAAN